MLYSCIMDSLSDVGRNKVNLHRTEFIVNDVPCGVCLLKVVIRESAIDSNATANSIRNQLSELHVYIQEVGCDIIKFNQHVKLLVERLSQRGQTSNDLLVNLFKAYKAVARR